MKIELNGLSGLLFIIFLILKLTKVVGWSWWWVTSPLWLPIISYLLLILIYGIFEVFRKNQL